MMDKEKILVVTSSVDDTASYVIEKYKSDADFVRLNIDRFNEYSFSVTENGWYITSDQERICENDIRAIYYRKPMLPDVREYEPRYRGMIQRDIIALVNGIVDSFDGIVISKPSVLRKAENKIFQLIYAGKKGIAIPQSYIGNSNAYCDRFAEQKSIIKPITTGKTLGDGGYELYQTSMFSGVTDDISLTPVYLQKYIDKAYEVRLTIIGESVYPVRIDTINKIDWRADYQNHKYSIISVPDKVIFLCRKMLKEFSLIFGAFDFIVTPEGEWVFLEVNPNGQWLWLEERLRFDISKKIMDNLLG